MSFHGHVHVVGNVFIRLLGPRAGRPVCKQQQRAALRFQPHQPDDEEHVSHSCCYQNGATADARCTTFLHIQELNLNLSVTLLFKHVKLVQSERVKVELKRSHEAAQEDSGVKSEERTEAPRGSRQEVHFSSVQAGRRLGAFLWSTFGLQVSVCIRQLVLI